MGVKCRNVRLPTAHIVEQNLSVVVFESGCDAVPHVLIAAKSMGIEQDRAIALLHFDIVSYQDI